MSWNVTPLSIEYSTTPPSNAEVPLNSNENLCVNEMVTGPVPAVTGGETRLESEGTPASAPAQKPSSAVRRLCDHTPAFPAGFHTEAAVSNVSVAEAFWTSSVLSGIESGTFCKLEQPFEVASARLKSPLSTVVRLSSSFTSNDTLALPYFDTAPTVAVGVVMWMPGVVELSVTATPARSAGPALASGTVIRAV